MMEFEQRYNNLNNEQRKAVDHLDGPLLVLAGPGSGKTELLGLRVANILKKTDTPPNNILCLTYTDAASVNMKERLSGLIGEDAYKVPVHTFHGLCQKIIEEYPEHFHRGVEFSLADKAVQTEILEGILNDLDHDDPLSGFHPEKGFAYLRDLEETISELKEGGFSPEGFRELIFENEKVLAKMDPLVNEAFNKRVDKNTPLRVKELIRQWSSNLKKNNSLRVKPLHEVVILSLCSALEGEKGALSEWKEKWTAKEGGRRVLKDRRDIEKMKSLSRIYEEYQKRMQEEGYYDFSDMILGVIRGMEEDSDLHSEIKERYLHTLVDEFQDTNGVQMRFLDLLAEDEMDNMPNICVVGDDDQAIYRFQGAEISNILDFKERYEKTRIITLKDNYRSVPQVLDTALDIIRKGENRLENVREEISKELRAKRKGEGVVTYKTLRCEEEEYSYVAKMVKEEMNRGVPPEEIAVIGRTHDELKRAVPFFNVEEVPVHAEKKEDVLKKEHVSQIITILRFAFLLLSGDKERSDELLPEILSFPFWNIERKDIWLLSRRSFKEGRSWLECMREDSRLMEVADFLLDLSVQCRSKPPEEIIDIIIGNKKGYFQSPFKEYYFSQALLEDNEVRYLELLSSLRALVNAVKEYRSGRNIGVKELLEFFDIHENNNIPLLDKNPLTAKERTVSLITAHGAKGKEFETVFVLNCEQDTWARTRGGRKLRLPMNIPFKRSGEEKDDKLRLFYVSLTRAKNNLYLVSRKKKEDGKDHIPLEFLSDLDAEEEGAEIRTSDLVSISGNFHINPFTDEERKLLHSITGEHKISATGLTKFLDVATGGPWSFFQDNILKFPAKKSVPLSYGTAIHGAIAEIFTEKKRTGKVMPKERFLKCFEQLLHKERLSEKDHRKVLRRGKEALSCFYDQRKDSFREDCEVEKNFRDQECYIGEIGITGKIDKIEEGNKGIKVTDFKTGKPLPGFKGKSEHEKINAWKYRKQILFYKLLVESAKDYEGKEVNEGSLEFVEPSKEGEVVISSLQMEEEEVKRTRELVSVVGSKIRNLDLPSVENYKKSVKGIEEFESDLLERRI